MLQFWIVDISYDYLTLLEINLPHSLQGGALWFQNLTEFSHGVSGPIFPLLIAGLHYINVQVFGSLVGVH